MKEKKITLKICTGHSCSKKFSQYIVERAQTSAKSSNNITIETCGCRGLCKKGPNVIQTSPQTEKSHSDMSPIKIAHLIKKLS